MKTIAIYNNKGGVGKTTTVINLAYTMGELNNKNILVIDCDGQSNSSRFFSDSLSEDGVEKSLVEKIISPEIAFSKTRYKNIDIIKSTSKMNKTSTKFELLSIEEQKENLKKLKTFWENDNWSLKYDYIILDLPPALNYITEKLLSISDAVIVPIELGTFAIQGIANVTDIINKVGSNFLGCFVSKFDTNNKSDFQLEEILRTNLGEKVFHTVIPYSNAIKNSVNYKLSSHEYMKWINPVKKYEELTSEIIERLGN